MISRLINFFKNSIALLPVLCFVWSCGMLDMDDQADDTNQEDEVSQAEAEPIPTFLSYITNYDIVGGCYYCTEKVGQGDFINMAAYGEAYMANKGTDLPFSEFVFTIDGKEVEGNVIELGKGSASFDVETAFYDFIMHNVWNYRSGHGRNGVSYVDAFPATEKVLYYLRQNEAVLNKMDVFVDGEICPVFDLDNKSDVKATYYVMRNHPANTKHFESSTLKPALFSDGSQKDIPHLCPYTLYPIAGLGYDNYFKAMSEAGYSATILEKITSPWFTLKVNVMDFFEKETFDETNSEPCSQNDIKVAKYDKYGRVISGAEAYGTYIYHIAEEVDAQKEKISFHIELSENNTGKPRSFAVAIPVKCKEAKDGEPLPKVTLKICQTGE
ncbi:MAG: hypothetical protein HUJ91_07600 [Bacteroidales bacterium]|nr:hypothetical protein [Bacteroidales bacterium]